MVLKLLVIDDDEFDRLYIKRALRESGIPYQLTESEGTASVSDLVMNESFDCIFLDYLLPGNNGLSLLKKIREKGIKTPVVIITSQGNESIAVELMKAGASDYIIKNDINGVFLEKVLRNMLRLGQAEREREEAERALKISEARLAEAQRIAKVGNWEYDIATAAVYWSAEVYNIYGFSPTVFLPTMERILDCIHAEDRPTVESVVQRALQGDNFNIDFRLVTTAGIKYVNAQGYVYFNDREESERIVGTIQDITERKLSEQEILKARELAESSMKVREVFLANMSHEIRTPLNAILGFARLLDEMELSAEQRGYIDAIHFSGENLLVIINDILDLSKLQSGKMTIEKCDFNFGEVVTGVISMLRPRAKEKGLQFHCKIGQEVPLYVKGDAVRLNQVLTNLISNAIKFTEKGGVYLNIGSAVKSDDVFMIDMQVRDTGIGIPHDKQTVIFENFVQASSETTRKYGGSGLGLTIVKSIVDLLEGTIVLQSEEGRGSVFTVHLPFERASQAVAQALPQAPASHESLDALRGASVLVVEDNGVNQLLVKKVLDKVFCKTDIAANGLEAIQYIREKRYDVVLMDVQMPEMDGIEATRYIRTKLQPPHSQVPIIAMTAHAFGADVNKCISAGMNDYISKPFKADVLYAKVAACLKTEGGRIVPLRDRQSGLKGMIDLSPIHALGNGDQGFINDLILVYDRQTPLFVEKLRGYLKSNNFEALRSICNQIKSSYGILKLPELDKALQEIFILLDMEKPRIALEEIKRVVNGIISLISAINQEVKRNLRKTG